ncbi:MAG: adenylosuccinate synthase [Candidatus Ancillula sp.]|jgi:adenylosuccinate synthase|nr:adenylosuccinate synthase [Candidatus Ancillula sp.]
MSGIVIVGAQWGDEGKGKATDLLGNKIDLVAKFNGGNNAGHTVVVNNETYALHLLPSGILTPSVIPVIANGVVIDVPVLFKELDALKIRGIDISRLLVSSGAHVITKYHRALDSAMENDPAKKKIGTTGRGIGPTYADKISRSGIRIADLFNENVLCEKIDSALDSKNRILTRYERPMLSRDEVIEEFTPYLERLKPLVEDTPLVLNQALDSGKNVLFEGGQATMLDVDFGTYPFVTSSNATAGGACTGTGVSPTRIDKVVGVIKAYTTRVGEGPFPTEISAGDKIANYLLKTGGEFGVTTGRARRCGWYDAVVAKYSSLINNFSDLVLTKLDILTGLDVIKVCIAYDVNGKTHKNMPSNSADFAVAKPIYKEFPGWSEDISSAKHFQDLPKNAQNYITALEELSGSRISVIGVGADRDAIIERHKLL